MPPDEQALIAAVLAAPADDLPRLVYADWLDEHGRPERAGLIRVEVAKANTGLAGCPGFPPAPGRPRGCGTCEFCRLEVAAERVHGDGALWAEVAGDLPFGYAHTGLDPAHFRAEGERWPCLFTRRGFVAEMHGRLSHLRTHLPALVRSQPVELCRATDRSPGTLDDGAGGWCRGWGEPTGEAWELPVAVWDRLAGHDPSRVSAPFWKWYRDVTAAHADLSAALLAEARDRARGRP